MIAYVATFMIEQSISKETNSLSVNETEINNLDDDEDDFIPYQGERFSIFDWSLFKVINIHF